MKGGCHTHRDIKKGHPLRNVPKHIVLVVLPNLDSTVEGSGLVVCYTTLADDVELAGVYAAVLGEIVGNSLCTVKSELVVECLATGSAISSSDNVEDLIISSVSDNVLSEEIKMSFLTSVDLSGVDVEEGARSALDVTTLNNVNSVLMCVLEGLDLSTEGLVLSLELIDLVLEVVVIGLGEGQRNDNRKSGRVTAEAGLAKVDSETKGSGNREVETARAAVLPLMGNKTHKVEGQVNPVTKTEGVEQTTTCCILEINGFLLGCSGCLTNDVDTGGSVRHDVPEAGLFVTLESGNHVPHGIGMDIVLIHAAECTAISSGDSLPTGTHTKRRGNHLTEISINSKTAHTCKIQRGNVADSCVVANTYAKEPVVLESVGEIRATNDLSVLVHVSVLIGLCLRIGHLGDLLSRSVDSEKSCECKDSENCFNSFHVY